mmetsp:Transcript_20188/g.28760  ORF Transcript_20188/g.28760 Transcript_20188/m.28760 type:complete len:105 (-) Transcript_20188:925-1239(-)
MDSTTPPSSATHGTHPLFAAPIATVGQGSSVYSHRQESLASRSSPISTTGTGYACQDSRPPRYVTPNSIPGNQLDILFLPGNKVLLLIRIDKNYQLCCHQHQSR